MKLLSPWKLKAKERNRNGDRIYDIPGVVSYDYMKLYKKFNLAPRESYSLNSIATVELDEKKVDYSEYDSSMTCIRITGRSSLTITSRILVS